MKAKLSVLICFSLFIAGLIIFCAFAMVTATTSGSLGRLSLIFAAAVVVASILFLLTDFVIRLRNTASYLDPRTIPNLMSIGVFTLIILQPLMGLALGVEAKLPNFENRPLAGKPNLSIAGLRSLHSDFINYVNDNFGFRKLFIHWNSVALIRYFDTSSISQVVLGSDDWLFYSDSVNDYQGISSFNQKQLQSIQLNIERQKDWLAERGIYYLIVVAPNKESIYPEFLPENLRRHNQQTRMDQLRLYIESHSDMEIVDLRDALLEAKNEYPVFYHTDTHWNKYGAFVGYCKILGQLSKSFADLQIPSSSDFDIVTRSYLGNGDLAGMLAMPSTFREEEAEVVFKGNVSANSKKIEKGLIFGDSFYIALEPYMSGNFEKFVLSPPGQKFDQGIVEQVLPKVVITVMVERDLAYYLLP